MMMDILFQIFENLILFSPFYVFAGMGSGKDTGKLTFRTIGQTGSTGLKITECSNTIVISTTASGVSAIQTCQIAYGTGTNITSNYFCGITNPNIKAIVGSKFFLPNGVTFPPTAGSDLLISGTGSLSCGGNIDNIILSGRDNSTCDFTFGSVILGGRNNRTVVANSVSIINSILSNGYGTANTILNSHVSCLSGTNTSIIGGRANIKVLDSSYNSIIGSYFNVCIYNADCFNLITGSKCSKIKSYYKGATPYNSIISSTHGKFSLIGTYIVGQRYGFYEPMDENCYSSVISSASSKIESSKFSNIISSVGSNICSNQYYKLQPGYSHQNGYSLILSSYSSSILTIANYGISSALETKFNTIIGSRGDIYSNELSRLGYYSPMTAFASNSSIISSFATIGPNNKYASAISSSSAIFCADGKYKLLYNTSISTENSINCCASNSSFIASIKPRIYGDPNKDQGKFNTIIASEGSGLSCTIYSSIIASNNARIYGGGSNGSCSTILSSDGATIDAYSSQIISGSNGNKIGSNVHKVYSSQIIGSEASKIYSSYSSIISSSNSLIDGSLLNSSIIGGYNNTICSSNYSAIIGGKNNILSYVNNSVIIGGYGITLAKSDTAAFTCLMFNSTQVSGSTNFGRFGRICTNTTPTGGIKIRKGLVTNT